MTKPTDSPAAKLPMPRGFKLFIALAVLMVVGAAISLFDKSEFYADVFIEISVFAYLVGANIYVIVCLGAFSTVFFTKMNQGVGVLLIIQIIFSCLNLVPIIIYHLTDREFFYTYQRQLIYPTLFFVFVLLGHLPGGDVLTSEVSHEIFSLIIFAQAFEIMDAIHKVGKAHHMAAYAINTQPLGTKLVPDTDDADDSEGSLDEPEDVEE